MLSKISSMLDAVADSLEAKGLIKEAYEIDKVADEVEATLYNEPGTPVYDLLKSPHGPGWLPEHESKETFTIDQLDMDRHNKGLKLVEVLDDRGKYLYKSQPLPGYGGWGGNAPTKFVTIDGKKAIFENMGKVRGGTSLENLKLKWSN